MISSTDYIQHHLKYLTVSLFHKGASDAHLDTFLLRVDGRYRNSLDVLCRTSRDGGGPGRLQNFAELLIDFADAQVKDSFHGHNPALGP